MLETLALRGRRVEPFGTRRPLVRAAARVGLGDVTQDPGYQAAWGQIQGQLTLEGANSTDIQGAATALQNSWQTLVTTGGMSGSDALRAATAYVLHGQTIGGAADMATNLVSAALSGAPPAQLLQTFTGTMIGITVAAGAIAPGVGAAIVAGVDVVVTLLEDAGLFGSPPQGTQYCPGQYLNGGTVSYMLPGQANPNNGQQNCCAVLDPYATTGQGIATNSTRWRHFPNPMSANPSDLLWYVPSIPWGGGSLQWTAHPGEQPVTFLFGSALTNVPPQAAARPIDCAFPLYHQIECEGAAGVALLALNIVPPQLIPMLTQFQSAFYGALKLNWEYALNGLKPQQDWQVLAHCTRMWNRSHDSSAYYDLAPSSASPWTYNGTPCAGIPPWYAAICAQGIVSNPVADIMSPNNAGIRINLGAPKPFTLSGLTAVPGQTVGGASSSSSSGKAIVVVGAGAAAGAGALYWYAQRHGITMRQALARLFK